jgi:hypothetical protein
VPNVRLERPHVRPYLQEPGANRREVFDDQLKFAIRGSEKKAVKIPRREFSCGSHCTGLFLAAGGKRKRTDSSEGSMKLLTWNACRLLASGREVALVRLLQSTGADIDTITEC